MLKTLLLLNLEKALQHALEMDASVSEKMAALEGKVIAFELTDFKKTLFFCFTDNRVNFQDHCLGQANLNIKGTLSSFIKMAMNKNSSNLPKDMEISGSIQLAQDFQRMISQLDLDWEGKLAEFTGEMPAHYLNRLIKKTRSYAHYAVNELNLNTREFLQEEIQLLPTRSEVKEFCFEVDKLRHAVARLEARVRQL